MAAIINKNHVHGNDVRSVRRKQNCTLSEKVTWIVHEIIKNAGYKEKNNKPEVHSGLALDRYAFNNKTRNDEIKLSPEFLS